MVDDDLFLRQVDF